MKKFLFLRPAALLFTLLLTAAPLHAYTTVQIDNIYYYLNSSNNTAEVMSVGSYGSRIVIPSTVTYNKTTYSVTEIDLKAFDHCTSLKEVVIPNSVKMIHQEAFSHCTSLTSITIPNSVTYIGDYAFWNCTSLTSITIPNSVTQIGNYCFLACTSLSSVTISNSLTRLGWESFYGCTSLTSVTIPESVTSISYRPFGGCSSLQSINVANNNEYYCSKDGVLYTKDMSELIQYPARKTTASFVIPNSVTQIQGYAFDGCTILTKVTIPVGVTSIGSYAFSGCTSLIAIYSANPTPPSVYSSYSFDGVDKKACTLYVPEGAKEKYEATNVWNEFYNIVEDSSLGVNGTTISDDEQEVNRYTLDGKQLSEPQKGVNIIRYSDGTTKKVLVK